MYCSKCGVRNGDENKVCYHCGAPMPGAGMAEEGEVPRRNEYGAPRREREYTEPREGRDEADTLAGIAAAVFLWWASYSIWSGGTSIREKRSPYADGPSAVW